MNAEDFYFLSSIQHAHGESGVPHILLFDILTDSDAADNKIAQQVQPGDLIITANIPLAADVTKGGGRTLNPREELYMKDTIQER